MDRVPGDRWQHGPGNSCHLGKKKDLDLDQLCTNVFHHRIFSSKEILLGNPSRPGKQEGFPSMTQEFQDQKPLHCVQPLPYGGLFCPSSSRPPTLPTGCTPRGS